MNCEAFEALAQELADGALAPAEAEAARAHASKCPACSARLDAASRFSRLLAERGDAAIQEWTAHLATIRATAESAGDPRVATSTAPPKRGVLRRLGPFAGVAAAAVLVTAVLVSVLRGPDVLADDRPTTLPRGAQALAGDGGRLEAEEDAEVTLHRGADGTVIRLDAGAVLFLVEPAHAFAVDTPQGRASALGTSFHVAVARDGQVTVTVLAGRVKFAGAREATTLGAGDRLEIDGRGAQRLVGRRRIDQLESQIRDVAARVAALHEAQTAAPEPAPQPATTVGQPTPQQVAEAARAYLDSDEGRQLITATIEAREARKGEDFLRGMHESLFAKFVKDTDLPADQKTRVKTILDRFLAGMFAAMAIPPGATKEERDRIRKESFGKIAELRKGVDEEIRRELTPEQFEIYQRDYPVTPPKFGGQKDGRDDK